MGRKEDLVRCSWPSANAKRRRTSLCWTTWKPSTWRAARSEEKAVQGSVLERWRLRSRFTNRSIRAWQKQSIATTVSSALQSDLSLNESFQPSTQKRSSFFFIEQKNGWCAQVEKDEKKLTLWKQSGVCRAFRFFCFFSFCFFLALTFFLDDSKQTLQVL